VRDAIVIEAEPAEDERGFFARTFDREMFAERGMVTDYQQWSISYNRGRGTLRGLHYQTAPYSETKLVRCTRGVIYDVVVDLRAGSPTYRMWMAETLSAENRNLLYVPVGCAQGFLTLAEHAEVHYFISAPYHPECAAGVRWNDPAFGITWPEPVQTISTRDAGYPDFDA
jgi:dTDP-4-dehydrorhamnose 3,5-epimerase